MKKTKNTILIILIVFLFGYGFHAFATDASTAEQDLAGKMDTFVKILSWIRIPIANLAGKFMTNSLVTGEVLKIADFLFQGWSLSRTVVNFIIVGVIMTIIWDIIQKGSSKDLGSKISKLILTTIAVNVSWFAVSAMVDLGTLALLGVSNMGTSIINSLPVKQSMLEQIACPPKEIIIDLEGKPDTIVPSCIGNGTDGTDISSITPTSDSMAGPLMYFGNGVFHIFDFISSNGDSHEIKAITIGLFVKLFLMIMFITPIIALLVVNFARIFMIWMRFLFAPFIALRRGMQGSGVKWLDSFIKIEDDKRQDYFDIKNIIGAIFAPAMVAATLFLAVITIASLFGALTKGVDNNTSTASISGAATKFWNDVDGGVLSIDNDSISIEGGAKVTFDGNIYEDTKNGIMGSFGYLIICVMTMGLLWAVFRVGLSTSKLLSGYGQTVMDAGKRAITTGIKLPVGIDGKNISLDQIGDKFGFKGMEGIARGNLITQDQRSQQEIAEKTKANILEKVGIEYDQNRLGTNPYDDGKNFGLLPEDLDKNRPNSAKIINFETESQKFFKGIMDNLIAKGTTIKGDSTQFKSAINSRLTGGGFNYLISKGVLKDPDKSKYYVEADGVKTFSVDKFWADSETTQITGGLFKKIFSKEFYKAALDSQNIFKNYVPEKPEKIQINGKYKIKASDFAG